MAEPAVVQRYAGIDLLKATAILTVILIHAMPDFGEPRSRFLAQLDFATLFAVPAFFFASGFLAVRVPATGLRHLFTNRIVRLLVPYLVATMLVFPFRWVVNQQLTSPGDAAFEVLTGSAFGIYYFVPVLLGAVLVAFPLRHAPWLWGPLCGAFLVLRYFALARRLGSDLSMFWYVRNPLLWWGPFFLGGYIGLNWDAVVSAPSQKRRAVGYALSAIASASVVVSAVLAPPRATEYAAALSVVFVTSLLPAVTILVANADPRPSLRWLSDASFTIYLYHYFFVVLAKKWIAADADLRIPACYIAGLVGSVAVVLAVRRLLPKHARLLFG